MRYLFFFFPSIPTRKGGIDVFKFLAFVGFAVLVVFFGSSVFDFGIIRPLECLPASGPIFPSSLFDTRQSISFSSPVLDNTSVA